MSVDLKNDASLGVSLVSHWNLDETETGSAVSRSDATANQNTLTDNNTVASATGLRNNAGSFVRASSEYLSITDAAQTGLDIGVGVSYTISAWVKFTTLPSGNTFSVVSKMGTNTHRQYIVGFRETGSGVKALFQNSSDGTNATNANYDITVTVSTGTWYHCVWAHTTGTGLMEFYLNGASQGTQSGNTSLSNQDAEFRIGGDADGGSYFDGQIDEVTVWSKLLTSGDVTSLYNSGTPLPYLIGGGRMTII